MPKHRPQSRRRKLGALGGVLVAVVAGTTALYGALSASASVPTPELGYVTVLPSAPRVVAYPGTQLNAGQTVTVQIAGENFSGTAIPSNTTGVTVSISSVTPAAAGNLKVWTAEAGEPGTPAVVFGAGQSATNVASVGLNSTGKLNVKASVKTRFVLAITEYVTPVPVACKSTLYTIPAAVKTLTKVGGSIRTGATDFGSVTLPAGTYDTRVVGGFTGLNNGDDWLPADVFLTGTLTVVKGDEINATFTNNVTAGGVLIPKSNSATLTQDPTLAISTFLVLDAATDVHVKLFAYASNSGTAGSDHVKANVQSAQFRSTC